ncbi:hypothetical protein [Cohnella massiliensis]|uniref:hypothetical protein n=1 Tax=Cohnella massiliensis TaxID=1816691 RepID=UPI0009BAE103|nr:hypothetical protein [Cohnella massiliensis]
MNEAKGILDCENVEDFLALFRERQEQFEEKGIWSRSCIDLLTVSWTEDILKLAKCGESERLSRLHYLMIARHQFNKFPA